MSGGPDAPLRFNMSISGDAENSLLALAQCGLEPPPNDISKLRAHFAPLPIHIVIAAQYPALGKATIGYELRPDTSSGAEGVISGAANHWHGCLVPQDSTWPDLMVLEGLRGGSSRQVALECVLRYVKVNLTRSQDWEARLYFGARPRAMASRSPLESTSHV